MSRKPMTKEEYDRLTPYQKGAASVWEEGNLEIPTECPYPSDKDMACYLWSNGRKKALHQKGVSK